MNLSHINSKSPELPSETYTRLYKIFKDKQWSQIGEMDEPRFDNFCQLLASMDEAQCDMILTLTEKFLWVKDGDYLSQFIHVFDLFVSTYQFKRGKKICICPLIAKEDFYKVKSSLFLFYKIKACLTSFESKYPEFNICCAEFPTAVNFNKIKNEYTLCLIDDFVGTGETVRGAMSFFENEGISVDMVTIISLVGMEEGINNLKKDGYDIYCGAICQKGITNTENEDTYSELMCRLEEKMRVNDSSKFGYGHSEALVKMLRTPNNTFPIYWLQKNNPYAPFPR